MAKIALATVWLDGCSGCHMSLLDLDSLLVDLMDRIDLVFSPLVDCKHLPEQCDVALVEGAVSSEADLLTLLALRASVRTLVALGDCAVTANVPGMRNRFTLQQLFSRAYLENAVAAEAEGSNGPVAFTAVPCLFPQARPVHEFVPVDIFLPGCPPPAAAIATLLNGLLVGDIADLVQVTRFGA